MYSNLQQIKDRLETQILHLGVVKVSSHGTGNVLLKTTNVRA